MKKGEKLNKYLELSREMKNLWNIKVSIFVVAIGTFSKNLEKKLSEQEIREEIKTI